MRPDGYETDTAPTHEVIAKNGKSVFKKADASVPEDVQALVETAVATFGRLDMYAGIRQSVFVFLWF